MKRMRIIIVFLSIITSAYSITVSNEIRNLKVGSSCFSNSSCTDPLYCIENNNIFLCKYQECSAEEHCFQNHFCNLEAKRCEACRNKSCIKINSRKNQDENLTETPKIQLHRAEEIDPGLLLIFGVALLLMIFWLCCCLVHDSCCTDSSGRTKIEFLEYAPRGGY